MGEEDIISRSITEVDKKYDKPVNIFENNVVDSASFVEDVKEELTKQYYMGQAIKKRPSLSEAVVILKKNEWSIILWRKGLLTDEQVSIIANSDEKVLDLSLFDLTDYQLELLSKYQWEEIIFWFKKLTDRQAEIFSKYNAKTLNLSNLLRISDYQLEKLTQLKWKKLNLRDLVLSRIQKTMLYKYQGKVVNRVYSQWKEMNQRIIEEQRELKRQREKSRKIRSVAYTSFQYV